jgi:hypothetical protein
MALRRALSVPVLRGPSVTRAFLLALCCASGVLLAAPAASAHGGRPWRPPTPVVQPAVSVSLQSEHGHALTSVRHRGQTFVAGERGERYEIVVTNNTSDRIEVVVSVDGRDAVSGKLGDFTKQRGYVLDPFGSVIIDGFRTSLEQVAAFRFAGVEDSYTARQGTPQHAGVIGVAVFKEQPQHHLADGSVAVPEAATPSSRGGASKNKSSKAPAAPGRSQGAPTHHEPSDASNELGTEFGEQRLSAVRQVSFIRANHRRPDFTTKLRYDSARGLAARGVPIEVEPVIVHHHGEPDAWPGASSNEGFAQPPPPRRRRR